jgi:Ser/Thr protein kinase RdoA (MazF antagonist)
MPRFPGPRQPWPRLTGSLPASPASAMGPGRGGLPGAPEDLAGQHASLRPGTDVPAGPSGWTHGDFQHLNLIWQGCRVAGVIDWDRTSVRPLGQGLTRSATLLFARDSGELDLGRVAAFVRGYRTVVPLGREDLADAVDRMWWARMCDCT